MKISVTVLLLFISLSLSAGQEKFRVVGYYCGQSIPPDSFETKKLTHLIYCFSNLCENAICLHSSKDSMLLKQMVALKKKNKNLKVLLSLGGWGGCETCSGVFSTEKGRANFAQSVRAVSDYFQLDGLDLDWEYPVVKGFPGHLFQEQDKPNFTLLLRAIREACGENFELTFAAGGFTAYMDSAIDWKAVAPLVNFINVMSYDLTHGYSTITGHHTPLYSTPVQIESTDHAVQLLLQKGVSPDKIVIGAAFYGRFFQVIGDDPGLNKPGKFSHAFSYKFMDDSLSGFERMFDSIAQAPYAINRERKLFATFDDETSVATKTKYAKDNHLGGIMFWQLYDDKLHGGLLDVINNLLPRIHEFFR